MKVGVEVCEGLFIEVGGVEYGCVYMGWRCGWEVCVQVYTGVCARVYAGV